MKTKLLFVLLFTSSLAFSQSKFSCSLEGGVGGSFRDLYLMDDHLNGVVTLDGSTNGKEFFDYIENYMNKRESDQVAFSLFAKVSYQLSPKLSVLSGIGYQNIGERFEDKEVLSFTNLLGNIIPVYSDDKITKAFRYHYLSLPVEFRYDIIEIKQILKGKLGFSAGLAINYLIAGEFEEPGRYEIFYKIEYGELQKLAVNGSVGIFYELKLSNENSLFFQPQFSYFLTPNVKYKFGSDDNYITVNQYNYVYEFKIGYRFNSLFK